VQPFFFSATPSASRYVKAGDWLFASPKVPEETKSKLGVPSYFLLTLNDFSLADFQEGTTLVFVHQRTTLRTTLPFFAFLGENERAL
jgi:hypothetical protein